MMTLEVKARDVAQKLSDLREAGLVPGVFYGHKEASTPIALDARVFAKLWRDAGETTIITLTGIGEPKDALIKEVSAHPTTGMPEHVDFYVLEKGKKIEISVPLEFEGVSEAEKAGAVIVKVLHEIEIEVAPADLPQYLTVDLSLLRAMGDHITVSQISIPASASFITDAEDVVAAATEQKIVEDMPTTPPTEEEVATEAPVETTEE